MIKFAVITVQSEYLKKVTDQLIRIFKDRIRIHPIQLSHLPNEHIDKDEVVFSAIPKIKQVAKGFFPHVRNFVHVKRSINIAATGNLLDIPPGRKILVVSDNMHSARKIIQELEEQQFGHTYIPFSPDTAPPDDFEYVVTTGDLKLVHDLKIIPDDYTNIINVGLRVISLETIVTLNQDLGLGLDPIALNKNYMSSLVMVAHKWPVSQRNKYLTSWIGKHKSGKAVYRFSNFITHSQVMKKLVFQARKMARHNQPIHISGEIGTGKRRLAQAIHNASSVNQKPFARINCHSQIKKSLEKELFGWEENVTIFPGLFEMASGGTLCIEEIDHMGFELQNRLVQVLDEKKILRSNGRNFIPIQVRILTTSTQKIQALFHNSQIQKELYYRLSHFTCHMPSLVERMEDFDAIVETYLHREFNRPSLILDQATARILKNHLWEGNIQELFNVLAHLACLSDQYITPDLLPFYLNRNKEPQDVPEPQNNSEGMTLAAEIEKNGFLDECHAILEIYNTGKKNRRAFGRDVVCERLRRKDIDLTPQQFRLRQQRLNRMGLLHVRKGRAGTTISGKGERFLKYLRQTQTHGMPVEQTQI